MKKPAWGLWLMVIIAPLAVFFSFGAFRAWQKLPPALDEDATRAASLGVPLINAVEIVEGTLPYSWSVLLPVCNPTRERLFLRVVAIKGAEEIMHTPLILDILMTKSLLQSITVRFSKSATLEMSAFQFGFVIFDVNANRLYNFELLGSVV
jgi:hypothetical protein